MQFFFIKSVVVYGQSTYKVVLPTISELLRKMKSLEDILRQSSHGDSADSIERNTFLLNALLEEQGKTALLRTRYSQLN